MTPNDLDPTLRPWMRRAIQKWADSAPRSPLSPREIRGLSDHLAGNLGMCLVSMLGGERLLVEDVPAPDPNPGTARLQAALVADYVEDLRADLRQPPIGNDREETLADISREPALNENGSTSNEVPEGSVHGAAPVQGRIGIVTFGLKMQSFCGLLVVTRITQLFSGKPQLLRRLRAIVPVSLVSGKSSPSPLSENVKPATCTLQVVPSAKNVASLAKPWSSGTMLFSQMFPVPSSSSAYCAVTVGAFAPICAMNRTPSLSPSDETTICPA